MMAVFLLAVLACLSMTQMGCEGLTCPTNYDQYGSGPKCLRISTIFYTRDDGQTACEQDGGHLAKVVNADESAYIRDTAPNYAGDYYWIGLTDIAAEGQFVWSDGSVPMYTDWDILENQPNGDSDCVAMRIPANYEWCDRPCTEPYRILCQWTPSPPTESHDTDISGKWLRVESTDNNLQQIQMISEIHARSHLSCAANCDRVTLCVAISYSSINPESTCLLWKSSSSVINNTHVIDWDFFVKYTL